MSTDIGKETQRVRAVQDKHASGYDRQMGFFECLSWRLARGGTSRSIRRSCVATAVKLSPEMLALARARAAELGVEVDLRLGDAQALEFEDARFETVLITLPSERVRARR